MARAKLAIGDFDVVELNEAFAAQALAVLRKLGFADDAPHVNPHGEPSRWDIRSARPAPV